MYAINVTSVAQEESNVHVVYRIRIVLQTCELHSAVCLLIV